MERRDRRAGDASQSRVRVEVEPALFQTHPKLLLPGAERPLGSVRRLLPRLQFCMFGLQGLLPTVPLFHLPT